MVLEPLHDSYIPIERNVARSGMDILAVGIVSGSFHRDFNEFGKAEETF